MDFFHILNRGVDKRKVFMDEKDYIRFVHDLYEFNDIASSNGLTSHHFAHSPAYLDVGRQDMREKLVHIHFFCLIPNHYHLLLSPVGDNHKNISLFMKKLNGGYAKYFNEKYDRSGTLWQGKYKSVPIKNDRHFLYIPYYIHFNALDLFAPEWRTQRSKKPRESAEFLASYRWSSHLDYVGKNNFPSVTDRSFFLKTFGGENGYQSSFSKMLHNFQQEEVEGITLE